MKKRLFAITLAGILSFALAGCGKSDTTNSDTEKSNITSNNSGAVVTDSTENPAAVEQDTDDDNDMNTQNMISVDDIEVGKYKVTNEGRAVVVAYNDGKCVSTTSYNYKNDVLDNIQVIYKYADADKAKSAYEKLKADKSQTEKYENVELSEDKIKATVVKSEIDKLKSLTKQELYERQSAKYAKNDKK